MQKEEKRRNGREKKATGNSRQTYGTVAKILLMFYRVLLSLITLRGNEIDCYSEGHCWSLIIRAKTRARCVKI